jgi:NAD(P)-dependent dehydrogenase (short-subunit alcohol dehydrogenase family)
VFQFQADLRDEAQITTMFLGIDAILADKSAHLSNLAVLVNSAAFMQRADAREMSAADFDGAISLNLRAPFLCAQQAYQRMAAGGGLVVNISDIAAQKAWKGFPAYTVSKAGLDSLTKVLARSFAPRVRVNAIGLGLVLPAENFPAAEWQQLVNRLPVPRSAGLDEIVSVLEFLIKNEYIIGQTIVVDGGYSLI